MTDKGSVEENANALADMYVDLEEMKSNPSIDPREITRQQQRIKAMEWQIKPEGPQPNMVNMTYQGDDGKWTTLSAPSDQVGQVLGAITDKKEAAKIKGKQKATANLIDFAARGLDIIDKMGSRAPAAAGGLGSAAGQIAAWSDVLTGSMGDARLEQYRKEVGDNPQAKLDELMADPEAENYMSPTVYQNLSQMAKENAQLASVVIGMAYATAKASDEAGRVSDSDLAKNLSRLGYNADSWVQNPGALKAGLLETAGTALGDYATELRFNPDGEKLLKNDYLFNEYLQDKGFSYEDGRLRLKGAEGEQQPQGGQQQAPAEAPPAPEDVVAPTNIPVQPIEYQAGKPVYDATALNPDQAKQLKSGTLLRVPDGQGGFKYKRIP